MGAVLVLGDDDGLPVLDADDIGLVPLYLLAVEGPLPHHHRDLGLFFGLHAWADNSSKRDGKNSNTAY